jgi:hypothetical protein
MKMYTDEERLALAIKHQGKIGYRLGKIDRETGELVMYPEPQPFRFPMIGKFASADNSCTESENLNQQDVVSALPAK